MPVKQSPPQTEVSRIPKWSKNDQDFWLDSFASLSDTIVSSILESEERTISIAITSSDDLKERLKDGVRTAAELADTAVEEALYRGWVQESRRKAEQTKRRPR